MTSRSRSIIYPQTNSMIYITRNKNKKFEVIETSDINGQVLSSSPQQFERRAGCYTNLIGRMRNWQREDSIGEGVYFQDDTRKIPTMYYMSPTGIVMVSRKRTAIKPYVPHSRKPTKRKKI